jgi:hypothetical protein
MSTLTVEQRADLAEQMLPVAAHLTALVHGDGGPEDVAKALEGLNETQKNALIVVLAGLVDPEQPVGKALSWLDVTKHGALGVASWMGQRPLREHVPDDVAEIGDDYIDEVAVQQHLRGTNLYVTNRERLEAVARGVRTGMDYPEFDAMYGLRKGSTATFVSRMRRRLEMLGEPVPSMDRPEQRVFTEAEVIAIRERSARGVPDVDLALSFGTDSRTIGAICRGARYSKVGGPIRQARGAKSLKASREFGCGHADNSLAGRRIKEKEMAA